MNNNESNFRSSAQIDAWQASAPSLSYKPGQLDNWELEFIFYKVDLENKLGPEW